MKRNEEKFNRIEEECRGIYKNEEE